MWSRKVRRGQTLIEFVAVLAFIGLVYLAVRWLVPGIGKPMAGVLAFAIIALWIVASYVFTTIMEKRADSAGSECGRADDKVTR